MPAYWMAGALNSERYGWSWHGGEAVNESLTDTDNVTSALAKGKIDKVHVQRIPVSLNIPIFSGKEQLFDDKGNPVIITKNMARDALVMTGVPWAEDGIQILPRVVKDVVPVQNSDYGNILNVLVEKHGFVMAGAMMVGPRGNIFGIQMELPGFIVGDNDLHRVYLYIYIDRETGKQGFDLTVVRVVCANTHSMAVSNMPTIPQTNNPTLVLDYRTHIVARITEEIQEQKLALEYLSNRSFTEKDMDKLVKLLYKLPGRGGILADYDQLPDDPDLNDPKIFGIYTKGKRADGLWHNNCDRQIAHQATIMNLFEMYNDKEKGTANTAFNAWQAITHHNSHHRTKQTEDDSLTYNLFFGDRAKVNSNAWAYLMKM